MTDDPPPPEMSPEEFLRRIREPMDEAEREDAIALFRWFARAYPTPKDRLAYVRRKYGEWTRYRGTKPVT